MNLFIVALFLGIKVFVGKFSVVLVAYGSVGGDAAAVLGILLLFIIEGR